MATNKSSLVCAFLCLVLLVGSGFASTSELLYVLEGNNIVTYSVNNTTAATKKLGTLSMNASPVYPIQIFHAPTSPFLYILGFTSATQEYFWVYALASNGVPTATPIQILAVKPSLTQFVIHRNGKFAYAEYSWLDNSGGACNGDYFADIVLFTINPKTGKLTNTTKPVANFPCNFYAITYIYGLNGNGTRLYIDNYPADAHYGGAIFTYYYSAINTATGSLGPQVQFWSEEVSMLGQSSAFTNSLIAQNSINPDDGTRTIDVYPNSINPSTPIINCTSSMLAICGDSIAAGETATGIYFDPSGKYLFVEDQTTNEVPVIYVSLALKKLEASGASIPGNPDPVAFSPDGLLVYAVEGSEILVYVFNPHSGLLTARTTLNAPGVLSILPWL